jgi:hypothetical protein
MAWQGRLGRAWLGSFCLLWLAWHGKGSVPRPRFGLGFERSHGWFGPASAAVGDGAGHMSSVSSS